MQTEILRLKEKFTEYSGYLTNEAMLHYLCDMVIAQGYAAFNRKLIIQRIIRALGWNAAISVETVHNYISFDDMIIRKGAIAAYANDYVVIPMNMADGILLCRGKGNKDWNILHHMVQDAYTPVPKLKKDYQWTHSKPK